MQYNHYQMRDAEHINAALDKLPVARELEITAHGKEVGDVSIVKGFKAIEVKRSNGRKEIVACPSSRYHLVQHKEAFRPIIDGLTLAGVRDFKFVTVERDNKAELQIYVGEEAHDTVQLGLNCVNSFDTTTAVHYGFKVKRHKTLGMVIELVAYRQVCSNGMKMWIPLATEEDVKAAQDKGEEVKIRVRKEVMNVVLAAHKASIRHTKSADAKIQAIQHVVEALALLRNPVKEFIERMQTWTFEDRKKLEKLVEMHVGKRYAERALRQFDRDGGESLWDLYNAVTHVASHDATLPEASREGLLDRAAKMGVAVMNTITVVEE